MRGRGEASWHRRTAVKAWSVFFGAAVLWVGMVSASAAIAAPGDLDTTFAGAGFRLDPLSPAVAGASGAKAATLDEGSKLVAVGPGVSPGTVIVVRYTESGSLDPSFGIGGVATVTVDPGAELLPGVVGVYVDGVGRIIFAGNTREGHGSGFVARMNSNGESLDSSFGENGVAQVPGGSVVEGLAQGPGEKPVVVGVSYPGPTAFVARLSAAGDPDPGFGSGGTTETEVQMDGFNQGGFGAVALDGDEIVAASRLTSMGFAFVARFMPEGNLNQSYGESGIARVPFGQTHQFVDISGLHIERSGGVLLVGTDEGKAFLARLTAAGLLDQAFGSGGLSITVLNPPGYNPAWEGSEADAMAIESSGKIVVAGVANGGGGGCFSPPPPGEPPCRLPTTDRFALARFDATGSLDPTFGANGIVRYIFDEGNMQPAAATVAAALIDPEGRLLISGGEGRVGGYENEGGYLAARFDLGARVGSNAAAPNPPLSVSSAAPVKCVVPRLKGDSVAKARRELRRAGCRIGKVKHQADRKGQKRSGRSRKKGPATISVVSSRPRSGTSFLRSARSVNLTVRRGLSPHARR